MKKIKNLLVPLACVASSAAIIAPLATSCKTTLFDTDVTHGYTPKIEKHIAETLTATEAHADYIDAIKKNPNIASEDYRYFGSQLNEYLQTLEALLREELGEDTPFQYNVKSFDAGLKNLSFDESGRVSYDCGMAANAYFALDLLEIDSKGQFAQFSPLEIELNLSIINNFRNFAGLDIKHISTNQLVNGTFVVPVWPNDLSQEDWSFTFAINGALKLSLAGNTILNLPNIDLKVTFDYSNYLWLQVDLTNFGKISKLTTSNAGTSIKSLIPYIMSMAQNTYIQDLLTYFGSYTSYYLSDVVCQQHFQALGPVEIWEDSSVQTGWRGTISFQMDEERTNFDDFTMSARYRLVMGEDKTIPVLPHMFPIDYDPEDPKLVTGFKFRPYIDAKGKVHKDRCSVDFMFYPQMLTSLENGKLEFYIYRSQPKGESYLWSERHNDAFYMDLPLSDSGGSGYFSYDMDQLPLSSQYLYEYGQGLTFNFVYRLTDALPAGSAFGIMGTDDGTTYNPQLISVESILADYVEFSNYIVLNNTIVTTKEISAGTVLNFVVNFIGDVKTSDYDSMFAALTPYGA